MTTPAPAPYTVDEAQAAADGWHFNCGPAAYGAVTGKGLAEIHEAFSLAGFIEKGYTNPLMMRNLTRGISRPVAEYAGPERPESWTYPAFGLVRIQWGGPWTRPGVPMRARYRATHWIAVDGEHHFDVNCLCVGGWVPRAEWETQVAPWIIRECQPKGDGSWWPTHLWEVQRRIVAG